jgi:hypothetical protein
MRRTLAIVLVSGALLLAGVTEAAKSPTSWDGLVQVPSKRISAVYLQPGADFRGYTKVMLDPTQVAFEKNWLRDQRTSTTLSSRITKSDLEETIRKGADAAGEIFAQAWTKGGYPVVTEPGPDVMRVVTGVVNIDVDAPDKQSAGRSRTYSAEAGQATLFVEVRDSTTGALLGRAVDRRYVGENFYGWRTSGSNRSDFRQQVEKWAEISVNGMNELKALSPIKQ